MCIDRGKADTIVSVVSREVVICWSSPCVMNVHGLPQGPSVWLSMYIYIYIYISIQDCITGALDSLFYLVDVSQAQQGWL